MLPYLILMIGLANQAQTCWTDFDSVRAAHVAAIANRDLDSYMATIAPREAQMMVLPDGTRWESRQAIREGHREWFSDLSWRFDTAELRRDVREHWGLIVYEVRVNRPDKVGEPFLLSMLFAPEVDGCWYLQHDQNTLLPSTVDEAG